jgi:hypothetical protein
MEAAVSLIAAIGGETFLTTTGLAVAAEGGGVVASAGLISAGSVISGGFIATSALATIGAANQQATALESEALFAEYNAKADLLEGRRQGIDVLKELNATIARNTVSGFASGLRGSGNVAQASLDAIAASEFELDLTRDAAIIRAGSRTAQAAASRVEAGATRTAGLATAGGIVASGLSRANRRGTN